MNDETRYLNRHCVIFNVWREQELSFIIQIFDLFDTNCSTHINRNISLSMYKTRHIFHYNGMYSRKCLSLDTTSVHDAVAERRDREWYTPAAHGRDKSSPNINGANHARLTTPTSSERESLSSPFSPQVLPLWYDVYVVGYGLDVSGDRSSPLPRFFRM
jgi:hypothetical protein